MIVRHKRTGEEHTAYDDDEGLWIDDPSGPGYAQNPKDWEIVG